METFLKTIGLTESNFNTLVGLLGLLLSLVIAIIPALRRLVSRGYYKILSLLGFTRSLYRRNFLNRHSTLHNIYLDKKEELDLRATYIPLHIDQSGHIGRKRAVDLLADPNQRRLIVVGDPGTGKTTLFKAFGTGILRPFSGLRLHDALLIKQMRETPILVDLRHFASQDYAGYSLVKYITDHVFQHQMKVKDGEAFLQVLLNKNRCLLLLDGLDEVSEEYYESTRIRISAFCNGETPNYPTRNARVIMSCRKQNFERLRMDWIPHFREVVTLVPFNSDEVFSFLKQRKAEFREGRTPEAFFKQIQASNMAELHRNPLILTISLGLFLNTPHYEIPNSVAQFYETIIKHLLHRHDFRTEPHVKKVNKYNADDKYRFLREFALHVAERKEGFDEFSYHEILKFFEAVHQRMTNVALKDDNAFIREIIDHSGLLTRVSDDDVYIFAHRSIHEYFIAVQLARNPRTGKAHLLAKADSLHWRQVIVFFASLDHAEVESFLTALMPLNLELAGYCVPSAQILEPELAEVLADALVQDIRRGNVATSLPALVSMTKSYRNPLRDIAMQRLTAVLGEVFQTESNQLAGLKEEDVPELLRQLANTGSITVLPTCLRLSKMLTKPTDAITPLWQCLAIPEIQQEKALAPLLVRQLLDLAMTPEGLEELQGQPGFAPDFVTPERRNQVYPFTRGQDSESNLVTLLAWADQLGAAPSEKNVFYETKQEVPDAWRTVERDRSRFTVKVHWYPIILTLNTLAVLGAPVYLVVAFFLQGWETVLLPGESWWWLVYYGGIGIISFWTFLILEIKMKEKGNLQSQYSIGGDSEKGAVIIAGIGDKYSINEWRDQIIYFYAFGSPILFSLSLKGIFINLHILPFSVIAFILTNLCLFVPLLAGVEKDKSTYLRKPNPAIAIYDDPRSKHWMERSV